MKCISNLRLGSFLVPALNMVLFHFLYAFLSIILHPYLVTNIVYKSNLKVTSLWEDTISKSSNHLASSVNIPAL